MASKTTSKLFLIIFLSINTRSAAMSYNLPKFCPNASWSSNPTTFPSSGSPNYLARGLFVSSNNTIYISNYTGGAILMWLENDTVPQSPVFASISGARTIFVADTGEIYADQGNSHRVSKATMNGSNSTTVISPVASCTGLFLDTRNILYCSMANEHQVFAQSLDNISSVPGIVAGNGLSGSGVGMLSYPYGIFVDRSFRLYVADCGNKRIERFEWGSLNGTVIADSGGSSTISLDYPTSVVLDADDNLFILDNNGNRIVGFQFGRFRCIVGCSQPNAGPPPLSYYETLTFDSYGNIYTTGLNIGVVRKFSLVINSCDHSTTALLSQSSPSTTVMSSEGPTSTHLNATMSASTPSTVSISTSSEASPSFITPICSNSTRLGIHCNVFALPCDLPELCQNNGTCINVNTSYICRCVPGFHGSECQYDHRPCSPNRCWNNGTCLTLTNSTFRCSCAMNWTGDICERKINYCENIRCENNGVCRPLLGDYRCECLGESFSSRHCEVKSTALVVRQMVSKLCAATAIIVLASTIIFVITMDMMKYIFGIDPARQQLERIQREKRPPRKRKSPVIQRFVYRDAPSTSDP